MSPDHHSDRLYARLAGGAELTLDERRHVATCADCQRAVADVARLDEQLRAASASLASEPIPDADLEPLEAPTTGWVAPTSAAIAAGVIAIAVGFGISQLRPPTGADSSPTPSPSTVAVQSAAPSASVSPMPEPTPPTTPLASGGRACGDGEAGFTILVPDGWYANLRQGSLMACSFLAPEPFDPLVADTVAPIRLSTATDPIPPGIVVEESSPRVIGAGDISFSAERWAVERAGEDWIVYVVALRGSIGDQPSYLHLGAPSADGAAAVALDSIVDRLGLYEPMRTEPAVVEAADALFDDADVCTDLERGVNVIYPDAWWTNTVLGELQACSYFAPERFDVADESSVPDGVAITLAIVTGNMATIEETLGFETLVVDQHAAERWELTPGLGAPPPDTRTYQYAVELDDIPDHGPSLVLTLQSERSDDYDRDKAVLDEMMRRIIISPTPALILDLERLPFCRSELVERTVEGDRYDAAARGCFWADYEADRPSQMISTFPTVEGTIVREIYRVIGPDEIEWITDATHDLGPGYWHLRRCTGLERRADDELTDAILFDATGCDDPVVLEP